MSARYDGRRAGTRRRFEPYAHPSPRTCDVRHTPRDEDVQLYIGNAFDIVGETKRMEYTDLKQGYTASYEVTLKNHKEREDVVITVPVKVWGDWQITASNFDYTMEDAFTAEFKIPVKADGEEVLTFSYKVTWK